ncbi:Uncharacterised protein [Klebsiella pneumoniae subsp. rhinoscleromatis]|nr:Uncharacterised protein [Klebsiella pneumoniae subsp. rhinoscleromatis]VTT34782.1 Uncharacterised protein [Klebsiella pneumoniae]
MERQQEIEERSRDLIRKADEKERQELKRFDLLYGIFLVLLFLLQLDVFLFSMKIFAICSPPLQNNCKVLFMMRLVRVRLFGWLFKLIL